MSKEITFGNEARLRIKSGIDKATKSVASTLGAVGMAAIIEFPGLDPIECDDGVTILKNLDFKDHYENLGLQKLRKAALRTSSEGGDGTATTTVLTQALVTQAFAEIKNDSSKIREVHERLQKGLVETIESLSTLKREVTDQDIERIANISSLDSEVAKLISEVIKEVGKNGIVTVEKGSAIGYSKEVVKGARFDRGFISQYFINEPEQERVVLNNPYIVLIDRKISIASQFKTLMDSINASGNKSVLIIADDVDGLALASLVQSSKTVTVVTPDGQQKQGTYDVACVRNPFNASAGKDFLRDMAALTGATIISEEAGMRLDVADVKLCGQAEKVIITKDNCTIIGGKHGDGLQSRIDGIEAEIASTTSEFAKMRLKDRLACLTGGIGVIRIGAYTDTDFNAKKYKFENAINATQAALQEGVVAGGGSALFSLADKVSEPMFKKMLEAPFIQMSINAGMIKRNWLQKLLGMPGSIFFMEDDGIHGWDFKNKKFVDMFKSGIIDPFKVVRIALESATAIASSLVTCETVITIED